MIHIVAAGRTGEGRPRPISDPAPAVTGKGTAYWLPDETHWRRDDVTITGQARNSGPGAARRPRMVDEPSHTIRASGSGSHPSGVEWVTQEEGDMRGLSSNQIPAGSSTYAYRPGDAPAMTVTGMLRSYRWTDGPVAVQTPGQKGGNMRLRNNSSANAAERELDQPAPTPYFGQRSNCVAWEGGEPPAPRVMMGAHDNNTEAPMTQTALDLFAGAGGWSLACKRLGIDEVGVENMKEALATRAAAGFKSHDVTDVWDIDYADLRGQYDGLIASPPCQTFSAAGKGAGRRALDDVLGCIKAGAHKAMWRLRYQAQALGDERTALVLTPLHAAWEMRPEWIAWEQVPTVLPVWEACAEELRSWGYSVWTGNLQAEQYGVPQTRKRAILLAHREREVSAPTPTHSRYYPRDKARLDEGVLPWVSMAQALGWGDFAMVSNYGSGGDPANRGVRTDDQPAPAVTSKVDRNVVQWTHERPSTTVVGSFKPEVVAAPGYRTTVSRQNAEGSVRVTVQEAGVLQSFPADFPWQGAKGKQYLQCGNAVPPLLAEAVLRTLVS